MIAPAFRARCDSGFKWGRGPNRQELGMVQSNPSVVLIKAGFDTSSMSTPRPSCLPSHRPLTDGLPDCHRQSAISSTASTRHHWRQNYPRSRRHFWRHLLVLSDRRICWMILPASSSLALARSLARVLPSFPCLFLANFVFGASERAKAVKSARSGTS